MKDPDETMKTIDEEGYLHSGDIGEMDEDHHPRIAKPSGFLTVTGRIKELIITAGGENIAPVPIENELKKAMPFLSNAIVIGDQRKFLSVLLTLQTEQDDDREPSRSKWFIFVSFQIKKKCQRKKIYFS